MSVTSNQSRLRRVLAARPMPFLIASSMLSGDEPTISVILYVWSTAMLLESVTPRTL